MVVNIRWKYFDSPVWHGTKVRITFYCLDYVNQRVRQIIENDSSYDYLEEAYWFNDSNIKTYVFRAKEPHHE